MAKLTCGVSTTSDLVSKVNANSELATIGSLLSRQEQVTLFGNSISASITNWVSWAQRASNGGFVILKKAAVPGDTTALMLLRLEDVTTDTTLVTVMEATNDAVNSVTVATHAANMRLILQDMLDRGINPVLVMAPPNDTSATTLLVEQMNLADYATARSLGIACISCWDQFADATDGSWQAGYSADGTHPEPNAEKAAGESFLSKLLAREFHIPLPYNNALNVADNIVNTNPNFIDSATGTPTRWTANGTEVTKALAVTSLGLGNTWQLNFSNIFSFFNSSRFDITGGDEYLFVMRLSSVINSGAVIYDAYIEYDITVDSVNRIYFFQDNTEAVDATTLSIFHTVPATVSTIRFVVSVDSGTYDVDINVAQAQMYNLTAHTY